MYEERWCYAVNTALATNSKHRLLWRKLCPSQNLNSVWKEGTKPTDEELIQNRLQYWPDQKRSKATKQLYVTYECLGTTRKGVFQCGTSGYHGWICSLDSMENWAYLWFCLGHFYSSPYYRRAFSGCFASMDIGILWTCINKGSIVSF